MSGDGVSYWEGPAQIREHADGLVEEGIDDLEPGIAASYRMLADLIDRIAWRRDLIKRFCAKCDPYFRRRRDIGPHLRRGL